MPKAALGRGDRVPFHLTRRASDFGTVELHQPNCAGGDLGQFAVFQHHRAARVFENRGNIRRDKILAVTESQHHRRRGLGGDQLAGFGFRQHDDGERTADAHDGLAHSLGQAETGFELLLDQMRDQLGIGFGAELVAAREQLGAQIDEVLDDAVVNDGDRAGFVRMRIFLGRAAVRRPSRVPDSDMALQRRVGQQVAQIFELALGAANFELAAIDDSRDAGRVVAAILEAAEPAEQDWVGLARPDVSDYSAHDRSLLSPQSQGTLQSFPNARRCENDSEIIITGEFRKSRQSRMLCHLRRVLSRGHPRGFSLLASIDCGAGKPSAESFDTASTSSTHAMNMSPGATLVLYFLSGRPSPRFV